MTWKSAIRSMPVIGPLSYKLKPSMFPEGFETSDEYWERRYAQGGNSGPGSYNRLAKFKAEVLNKLVKDNDLESVIEFGCGDGAQLELAQYPHYIGVDVSRSVLSKVRKRFVA